MGIMTSPAYGSGMDTLSYVLAMEEISKIDASASVSQARTTLWSCMGSGTAPEAIKKNI